MSSVPVFQQDHLVVRYIAILDVEECWGEHGTDELIHLMGESREHVVDTAMCVRQFLEGSNDQDARNQLRDWFSVHDASEEHLVDKGMIISKAILEQLSPLLDNQQLLDNHKPPGYSDNGFKVECMLDDYTVVLRRDFYRPNAPSQIP